MPFQCVSVRGSVWCLLVPRLLVHVDREYLKLACFEVDQHRLRGVYSVHNVLGISVVVDAVLEECQSLHWST
mgnify:CR=1 FL=1